MNGRHFFLILVCVLPFAVSGALLPSGNYKDSCEDIKMIGTTLQARCYARTDIVTENNKQVFKRIYHNAALINANRCAHVVNSQGNLLCNERDGPYFQDLPNGNYKNTCTDIIIIGYTLKANCKTGEYKIHRSAFPGLENMEREVKVPIKVSTELPLAPLCGNVENIKGQLRCVGPITPKKQ